MEKKFNILTIDGGGIRGIFPAMFLALIEAQLKARGVEKYSIYDNFQLIGGTSTGGIIAIALALGIPAAEIVDLYFNNASKIFGRKRTLLGKIFYSAHEQDDLENLIRDKFKEAKGGEEPILKDCKTNVCIPIYDLMQGKPSVLKNDYHPRFIRDYHIPAYQAAMATSAAPTYFDPYSTKYVDLHGMEQSFSNKVDGGVVANNPTLLTIIEAQKAFKKDLSELQVLSLGTGNQHFVDARDRHNWGLKYWVGSNRKRLIELFMQGQSQLVQNLISLLQNGIDREEGHKPNFVYKRIETELDETCVIELDETNKQKLEKLKEKAHVAFQNKGNEIIKLFFE
ncbi:MAG TPA: CBASS cGAMP-activated phospholipase [Hanamia sp.]|nr:CBASS cGAMP-activated phospholipase [Hanamia sp.]